MSVIGFVGLGNMGAPMSANLIRAGHRVRGFDLAHDARQAAADRGVDVVGSAAGAADGADFFITMLPNGAIVRDVLTGAGSALAHLPTGALVIDSSSIDVMTTRELHAAAAAKGLQYLDAPVSGGISGAAAGTLTFMAGGTPAALEHARPVIMSMGSNLVHVGGPGNGQAAKACNNMVVAASTVALAEAFVLADRMGLEARALYDIMSASTASCWSLHNFTPWPGVVDGSAADCDYRPRFAARLMSKDLHLALAAAQSVEQELTLTPVVARLFASLAEMPRDVDTSAVIREIPGYAHFVRDSVDEADSPPPASPRLHQP
jgi:3-hydroxyisobutyrate dehydrogenase